MGVYYNENDPFAAAWLRELIKAGLIADGEVDERSIESVSPDDLRGFVQCHFFAGIGGWSYALRLAGWPDDREAWTGSCPCQPFSSAGRRNGAADSRHLWPTWVRLIAECRPVVVFGEQVEGAIAHGWLDAVFDDLEGADYATASVGLPAASVGAFHGRPRLWFVAHTDTAGCARFGALGLHQGRPDDERDAYRHDADRCRESRDVGDAGCARLAIERGERGTSSGQASANARQAAQRAGAPAMWENPRWLMCRDGKARAIESGLEPLADGVPARVGRLRGYGNAIVPSLAAEFIKAYREAIGENLHGL